MLLFVLFFLLIYGGLNSYVYSTIASGLGYHPWPIALVLVLLVLSPTALRMAEERAPRFLAVSIAWVGYNWMGIALLFASLALITDVLQLLVPTFSQREALRWILGLAAILSLYGFVESRRIRLRYLTVQSPKLSIPEDASFRMVQISDVHLGYGTLPGQMRGIIEKIQSLAPDLIVSTGDLFDTDLKHLGKYVERLKSLQPPGGKLAVTGNHEVYAGLEEAISLTRESGFQVLQSEAVDVGHKIYVAGVDDPEALGNKKLEAADEEALASVPDDGFVVLLKHRPHISVAHLGQFDLQLSGHTHGGQIFPFIFMTRLQYKARHGLTRLAENTYLYLSRGTGSWGPQIRVLAPPEITVFDFRAGPEHRIELKR